MTTRYPRSNAHVAYETLSAREREDLKVGDEVIVLVNYGKHALRERVTKRTEKQVTLTNGSRYSLRTGDKIGAAQSYSAPHIIGRPLYTAGEAAQLNAAIVAAAEAAEQKARLVDILDRVEKLADERGVGIGQVLEEVNDLNVQRLGEAIRANEEAKRAGQ